MINDLFKHAPNTVGFVLSTHSYDEIIKFLSKLLSQLKSVLLLLNEMSMFSHFIFFFDFAPHEGERIAICKSSVHTHMS